MRTWVVGLVCALAAVVSGCSDDVEAGSSPLPQTQQDCSSVITDEVLVTLGWQGYASEATESAGRCEWSGDDGTITSGGRVGTVQEECDRIATEDGYQASTAWLADEGISDGCVVVPGRGLGLFEVIAANDDGVVQVRVAVLDERPLDDVRAALVLLAQQSTPTV